MGDCLDPRLQVEHVIGAEDRAQLIQGRVGPGGLHEDLPFGLLVGIADGQPHEEPVQLALGERVGAVVLQGVLGRHHQEGPRELERPVLDGDRALLHGLEKPALSARGRPVDLVRQNDLAEDRPSSKIQRTRGRIVDRPSQHVGREKIAGELDPAEGETEGASQGMRQGRLAHPGDVLEQDMTACQQGRQGEPDHLVLAVEDRLHLGDQLADAVRRGGCLRDRCRLGHRARDGGPHGTRFAEAGQQRNKYTTTPKKVRKSSLFSR
jgi:hypothetical protein